MLSARPRLYSLVGPFGQQMFPAARNGGAGYGGSKGERVHGDARPGVVRRMERVDQRLCPVVSGRAEGGGLSNGLPSTLGSDRSGRRVSGFGTGFSGFGA